MNPDVQKVRSLGVYLQGRRIGIINRLAGERHLFAFDEGYVDDPERPTLCLSYKGQGGGLVTAVRTFGPRLPPFFSNLLPEGHLRTYLAQKAGVNPEREFYLLAALGADVAGAVVFKPLEGGAGEDSSDRFDEDDPSYPKDVWIVKLPSSQFPAVPENEYVMLELAKAVGIQTPGIRLVPIADIQGLPEDAGQLKGMALAVERFDRAADGRRIHIEDFAQVFGVFPEAKYKGHSYANIAAVLWAETGEPGTYEFVRRLVFSVLIGNGDMHLKNWSVAYPDGRLPVLSPAYDFVATVAYIPHDDLALSFGGSRSLNAITVEQVKRFADTARLPMNRVWEIVREMVERTADAWRRHAAKDLIPAEMLKAIDGQIQRAIVLK